jgi:hypothetical protein
VDLKKSLLKAGGILCVTLFSVPPCRFLSFCKQVPHKFNQTWIVEYASFNYRIGKKEFKLSVFLKIISLLGNSENFFNVNKCGPGI